MALDLHAGSMGCAMSRLYKYMRIKTEKSFCPHCSRNVELLCSDAKNSPMFYICWDCKLIAEVGIGEVKITK